MKRITCILLMLLLLVCRAEENGSPDSVQIKEISDDTPVERAESTMEIVMIEGSLGQIYGELVIPAGTGKAPLVILSHGFEGC